MSVMMIAAYEAPFASTMFHALLETTDPFHRLHVSFQKSLVPLIHCLVLCRLLFVKSYLSTNKRMIVDILLWWMWRRKKFRTGFI